MAFLDRGRWLAVALVMAITCLGTQDASAKDYLSPELRKKVEKLKIDVARSPTSFENVRERGVTLFEWMNAYSMTGRLFYEYTTSVVSESGRFDGKETTKKKSADLPLALDKTIARLAFADEHPKALGTTSLSPQAAPFPAGSYQTITETYTLGEAPMGEGSAIIVARHWMPDNLLYQTEDPKADNYLSVKSSKKGISFERSQMDILAEFGGGNIHPQAWVFRIKGGTLNKGDKINVIYGDRSAGSKGLKVPTYSSNHMALPLFVYLAQEKQYFSLAGESFKVGGGKLAGVRGFAPSIVGVGEQFELSVRSEDDFYNRPSTSSPAYTIFHNGKPLRKVAPSENAITLVKNVSFAKEGIYRLTIRSDDGKIKGEVNPILVQKNPAMRLYWGETHSHSGMAEGLGTSDDLHTFGRDDARLDFLTHSEHDALLDDREWAILRQNTIDFYEPGKFITFLGYEFSAQLENGGHHNVLFRTPEGRERVPVQTSPELSQLYANLAKTNKTDDVLIIPHAHHPGDWRLSDPGMERLVELMSGHGTFEWFGQYYLANGFDVGFIAASDDHFSHPGFSDPWLMADGNGVQQTGGLAAVWAKEKSRDAIFDAMRARHAYGTTWERMIVDFRLNGAMMGERAKFSPRREIEGRVIGTSALDTITIIKNGKAIKEFDYATEKGPLKFPAKSLRVAVEFESPSQPKGGQRAVPRPTRNWKGRLSVEGAKLVDASFAGIDNVRVSKITPVTGKANERDYFLMTRGNRVTIILTLADVSQDSAVKVHVEGSRAGVKAGPSKKAERFIDMEPLNLVADMKKLQSGAQKITTTVEDEYIDSVVIRRLKDKPVLDARISFVDNEAFAPGDYYYIRAKQIDEGTAWSSPIWVGQRAEKKLP